MQQAEQHIEQQQQIENDGIMDDTDSDSEDNQSLIEEQVIAAAPILANWNMDQQQQVEPQRQADSIMDDSDSEDDSERDDDSDSGSDSDSDDDDDDDEDEEEPIGREQRFNDTLESIYQPKDPVAAATYRVARNARRNKLIKILQRHGEFPVRQRNKIDTSVEEIRHDLRDENNVAATVGEDDGDERRFNLLLTLQRLDKLPDRQRNKIDALVVLFLVDLEDDIHEMLCDQNAGEHYNGLDSTRDTEKEVETAIKFFPELLARRKKTTWNRNANAWVKISKRVYGCGYEVYELCPIECLVKVYGANNDYGNINLKAVSFISILAHLGTDLNQFPEEQRGGLLCNPGQGYSSLNSRTFEALLVVYSSSDEVNQLVDIVCLAQLIRLRRMNLFKKEDIRDFNLVEFMYSQDFAERRYRFLIEWDPTLLLDAREGEWCPLEGTAFNSVRGFQLVFELCIRYYPKTLGIRLLFKMKHLCDSGTSFSHACETHGRDKVMKIVENTLNNSDIPINTVEALFLAAIDDNIYLDCVYLLLKRQPDVLARLLSGFSNINTDGDVIVVRDGDHTDDADDDADDAKNSNEGDGSMNRNVTNVNDYRNRNHIGEYNFIENSVRHNFGLSQSNHNGTHTVTTVSTNTISSTKLSSGSSTGLPSNIKKNNNRRKERPILDTDTNNGKRKRKS